MVDGGDHESRLESEEISICFVPSFGKTNGTSSPSIAPPDSFLIPHPHVSRPERLRVSCHHFSRNERDSLTFAAHSLAPLSSSPNVFIHQPAQWPSSIQGLTGHVRCDFKLHSPQELGWTPCDLPVAPAASSDSAALLIENLVKSFFIFLARVPPIAPSRSRRRRRSMSIIAVRPLVSPSPDVIHHGWSDLGRTSVGRAEEQAAMTATFNPEIVRRSEIGYISRILPYFSAYMKRHKFACFSECSN